jgi:hypothetical protein
MTVTTGDRPDLPAGRRPAAEVVLIAYLGITAPLAILGGVWLPSPAVPLLHLAALALLVVLPRLAHHTRITRLVSDWVPLALMLLLYWELPVLMEALPGPVRYHDPAIVALERTLFGTEPAYQWAGAMPSVVLSELLHACYVSYYLLIYTPPLLVYLGPHAGGGRVSGSTPPFRDTV